MDDSQPLAQTYNDFHLIISDSYSTDNADKIVCGFDNPRLTDVRNDRNIGPTTNVNRCLDLADGEYVYILHHDDVMLPKNLDHKVRLIDANPKGGFVHSNMFSGAER